jgi:hypothetical protein
VTLQKRKKNYVDISLIRYDDDCTEEQYIYNGHVWMVDVGVSVSGSF